MSTRQQHALFKRYPLDSTLTLDGQQVTSPYHIYDGSILFIGGTADLAAARALLKNERLTPLTDTDGRAFMAMWVCDFTEANLGAHHELQLSIFAAYRPQPPVTAHPFAIYRFLMLNPEVRMICHGLWNNTALVVNYNREHLCLDAQLSTSRIEITRDQQQFQVQAVQQNMPVAEGTLRIPKGQDRADVFQMLGHIGFGGMLRLMRSPFVHVPVVNTVSQWGSTNQIAHTYTQTDHQISRRFNPAVDSITIHHPTYARLNFKPDFVQHGNGVHFVYLRPQPE